MSLKKTKTQKSNPPAAKVRVGSVTVAVWENEMENGTRHSFTFEKRYRDDKGEWHSTQSFNLRDMLSLIAASQMAHAKVIESFENEDEHQDGESA